KPASPWSSKPSDGATFPPAQSASGSATCKPPTASASSQKKSETPSKPTPKQQQRNSPPRRTTARLPEGYRLLRKYFVSPVSTLRATSSVPWRLTRLPPRVFRQQTCHWISQTSGPRQLSLMRYCCGVCSVKPGE